MPTYLYRCDTCGDDVAKLRPVAQRDAPLYCIACMHEVRRVFAPCAIRMPAPDWADFTHKDILAPHNYERKVWPVKSD